MKTAKLLALLLISFIATGSVVYQLRNRSRRTTPVVTSSQPLPATPTPVPAPSIPPPAAAPAPEPGASETAEKSAPRRAIAPNQWGRNPFLTPEEIKKLNEPQVVQVVNIPVQRAAEPLTLPAYAFTGIIRGTQGQPPMAILDDRVVRAGDRLGVETVKEIKENIVVLEYGTQTRQLTLKSFESTALATSKKGTKP